MSASSKTLRPELRQQPPSMLTLHTLRRVGKIALVAVFLTATLFVLYMAS